MLKNKFFITVIGFLCLGLAVYLSFNIWHGRQLAQRKLAWSILKEKINTQIERFGQEYGIVIKDLSTGWEIAINEDKLFPSASLVKLPIMASLFSLSEEKGLDLKQRLTLKNRCRVLGSGRLKDYALGSEFNIEDLIEIMVEESDNTAANMLIDYLGFDALNNNFKKLGLNNTNIARRMMDFKNRKNGVENFTSASDLAYLLEEIYNKRLINKSFSRKCLEILERQKIRDRIPARLPASALVANKTGLERGVCHDAGIVFTPKGDFIVCVLTRYNYKISKPAKRFISRIALAVYNYSQQS